MYDVDVYTHKTLQCMYMYNARLFLLFPSNQRFIVGNRMGVADYKIGQEANSKTDRQADRRPNYSNSRCACAPIVKLIYPSLSLDRECHW